MIANVHDSCFNLGVPVRVESAMRKLNCVTILDVLRHPPVDWLRLSNFNRKSLKQLERAVGRHGWVLGRDPFDEDPPDAVEVDVVVERREEQPPPPQQEDPPPQETRHYLAKPPKADVHAQRILLDDVVDICANLVKATHRLRRTKSQEHARECLKYEAKLRQHFPSITQTEAVRLANLVIHAASLSLRHLTGMKEVLPEDKALVEVVRAAPSRIVRCVRIGSETVSLEQALVRIATEEGLTRVTPALLFKYMHERGWETNYRTLREAIRKEMRDSPFFRQCSPKDAPRMTFRFVPEKKKSR